MLWFLCLLVFVALGVYVSYSIFYQNNVPEYFKAKYQKLMLIISHPDDEVMFFAPSLLSFLNIFGKDNIYILCITSGNFYGDGKLREKELLESCKRLGLIPPKVLLLQENGFADDPNTDWDELTLKTKINEICFKENIDVVLTFSTNGVSGHRNHIQTYKSVLKMQNMTRLFLNDVNILRKYSSFIDILTTLLADKYFHDEKHFVFVSSPLNVIKTYSAMCCHASQLVWFRKLYFLFSRYVLINHLVVCESSLKES